MIKLFQPPRPIGDVILNSVRQLKFQRIKLEQAAIRLCQRDNVLFQECVVEIRRNRPDRAGIRANELAEVRKLLRMITQCQLALERIILRLETIKEVTEIMADLKPALRSLHLLTESLVNVMPDVAQELGSVNEAIRETLATTHLNTPDAIVPLTAKTEDGEKILSEVSTLLEEKLAQQLPAPPVSVSPHRAEVRENVTKQMIALSATCSEIRQPNDAEEAPSVVTYKDVKLRGVSFTIQKPPALEETILEHAKTRGEIDIDQCAQEWNVPQDDIEKALENLDKKQRIVVQR